MDNGRDNGHDNTGQLSLEGLHPQHPLCVRHEQECHETRVAVKVLETAMLEHKLRLENGSRVFTDIKDEIATLHVEVKEIAKATAPKPVDWWRIVIPLVGFLVTLLTAWWALSKQLSDRPTVDVVNKTMAEHAAQPGHATTNAELRQLHDEQLVQGQAIKSVDRKVDETRTDVKDIKDDMKALREGRR